MTGWQRRGWLRGGLAAALLPVLAPAARATQTSQTAQTAARTARADESPWLKLGEARAVLFRHAHSPGSGDPPAFQLDDCATQRNLDEDGRIQARRIGEAFRANGIRVGQVLSSRWCRAQDSAELAFPGQRRDEPLFDSWLRDRSLADEQTRGARRLIEAWSGPGLLVVFTHQANIIALTGELTEPAEGIIVTAADGRIEGLGRLRP